MTAQQLQEEPLQGLQSCVEDSFGRTGPGAHHPSPLVEE